LKLKERRIKRIARLRELRARRKARLLKLIQKRIALFRKLTKSQKCRVLKKRYHCLRISFHLRMRFLRSKLHRLERRLRHFRLLLNKKKWRGFYRKQFRLKYHVKKYLRFKTCLVVKKEIMNLKKIHFLKKKL